MQIRTRLITLFISLAATLAAGLIGLFYSEHRIRTALDSNSKAYEIVSDISAMVGLATEINKAGLNRVQMQWDLKRTSLDKAIAEYRFEPAETQIMIRDLDRANTTFHELVNMMKQEMLEGSQITFYRARLSRYNHLTILLNNLSTRANSLALKNYDHIKSVKKSRAILFVAFSIILCALMAGWLRFLWRGIRSPLQSLSLSIFKVGEGELNSRAKLDGNDNELSRLTESYNSMLDRLQELTVSRKRLLEATELERARIGRELHDGISQTLVGVRLKIEVLPESDAERKEQLAIIANHLTQAQREIQSIVKDLRPAMLDDLGLVATLNWFRDEYSNGRSISLDIAVEEKDIPDYLHTPIYRIVQEATNNAFRHGDAHNLHIQLNMYDNTLTLFIEDDGLGFDTANNTKGNGLVNIQERVAAEDGELTIDSSPGRGCSIIASFPK